MNKLTGRPWWCVCVGAWCVASWLQPALGGLVSQLTIKLGLQDGECVVDLQTGSLTLADGTNELSEGHARLNGFDLVKNAKVIKQTPQGIELANHADGLAVRISLGVDQGQWLAIGLTLENPSPTPIYIQSLTLLEAGIQRAFPAAAIPIKLYSDSYGIWEDAPGAHLVAGQTNRSMYMGALFVPTEPRAWMFSFASPQWWSDMVRVDGAAGTVSALVEWWHHPFRVDPGEHQKFDTLYITHALNLTDALLAHGARCQPHSAAANIKRADGYNSWEWFKEDINATNQQPVVDFISDWPAGRSILPNYVLDNGWEVQYGDWSFNQKRFPEGARAWAGWVAGKGLVPGVWLAPTWETPGLAARNGFPNYGPTQGGTYTNAVEIDPSVREFREQLLAQIKSLRAAGFHYFKTDFLSGSYWRYTQGANFRDSKYPPERVLREFMVELRQAIGPDYWLACGTVIAPCAGLVDAARIGGDIKPKWDYVVGTVQRNAARFWMHGHFWSNDQDFLIIRGQQYSKPGFIKPAVEDIPAPGFTGDEAETWCNYLVISGGPITWSDDPQGITSAGLEIVRRTLLHGGGAGGIPLDLQTTDLPTQWVRRDRGNIYLGLFNWSDRPQTLRLTTAEVPELKNMKSVRDIFHDREFAVRDGVLEVTLQPHASVCVLPVQ
jgi:hypothetical protein